MVNEGAKSRCQSAVYIWTHGGTGEGYRRVTATRVSDEAVRTPLQPVVAVSVKYVHKGIRPTLSISINRKGKTNLICLPLRRQC